MVPAAARRRPSSAAAVAICLGGIAMGPSLWAALRQAAPEAVWAAALALKLGRSVTEAISFLGVFARAGLDLADEVWRVNVVVHAPELGIRGATHLTGHVE